MRNIILSNCTVRNGNRGCVALTVSAMSIIKSLLDEKGEEYTFYLPQSGFQTWESGEKKFISFPLELNYNSMMNIANYSPRNYLNCLLDRKQCSNTKKIYREADCILDIGQGDSFSDIYGKGRFASIHSQHDMGRKYKLPYCLLPQTIGPFENEKFKTKAVESMKYAKYVMVRDKQSFDYVKKICPEANVVECIDVAFYMPFQKENYDDGYIHVGLNVSALLWNGGYSRNNQFDLKVDYQSLIINIINYFIGLENVVVHLIPHVVGEERGIENDYEVCYDLWKKYDLSKLVLAPLFLDPIIAKNYISGMDFFMGARMHSTIAAFSSGVPVCPMAYSRKFNGLFEDTLNYRYVVDMKKLENDDALKIIKNAYCERLRIKDIIKKINECVVADRYIVLKETLSDFLNLK